MWLCVFFVLCLTTAHTQVSFVKGDTASNEKENLRVFDEWLKWTNPAAILYQHLKDQTLPLYSERDSTVAALKTIGEWKARQHKVQTALKAILPMPLSRAPLNATITKTIKFDGYSIQHLLFESAPRYFVTGCLYVPEKIKGKIPAVLHLMGHDQAAFRVDLYQRMNANFALKGMIVLTIDPPGQGERVQYYDAASKFSSVGYTVIEHTYFGNQALLNGISPAYYFVLDAQRAIDYLISRKDVDAARVGVIGFSGGGTIGSYVAAADPRIHAAVLCSWSTASKRQVETKGTQDAETVLYGSLQKGVTFADLVEVRAPKPTMLTFATRDQYLSIQGAQEAFAEASKLYSLYGKTDHLQFVKDDSKHWITPLHRKHIYAFFIKHFHLNASPAEVNTQLLSVEELTVTKTGQVSSALNSKLVFDLNKQVTELFAKRMDSARMHHDNHLAEVKRNAIQLSAYAANTARTIFDNGTYRRNGYAVSKLAVIREDFPPLPLLVFVPQNTTGRNKAVIYLHPSGKQAAAEAGGEIEKLVRQGYIVAAADLCGVGETLNGAFRPLSVGLTGVLSGASVVGLRAGEISAIASYLKTRNDVDTAHIGAAAMKELCIPLMHAAAFDEAISSVLLMHPQLSYNDIAANRNYKINDDTTANMHGDPDELDFSWGVAGALTAYDLADLLALIAPRNLIIAAPRDHFFEIFNNNTAKEKLKFVFSTYSSKNAADRMLLLNDGNIESLAARCFNRD